MKDLHEFKDHFYPVNIYYVASERAWGKLLTRLKSSFAALMCSLQFESVRINVGVVWLTEI